MFASLRVHSLDAWRRDFIRWRAAGREIGTKKVPRALFSKLRASKNHKCFGQIKVNEIVGHRLQTRAATKSGYRLGLVAEIKQQTTALNLRQACAATNSSATTRRDALKLTADRKNRALVVKTRG